MSLIRPRTCVPSEPNEDTTKVQILICTGAWGRPPATIGPKYVYNMLHPVHMRRAISFMAVLRLGVHARRCRGVRTQTLPTSGAAPLTTTNILENGIAPEAAVVTPEQRPPPNPRKHLLAAVTMSLAPNGMDVAELSDEDIANLNGMYAALMQPLPEETAREDRIGAMANTDTSEAAFFQHRERSLETISHWIRCLGVQGKLSEARAAFDQIEAMDLRANANVYSSLLDGCSRAGDIDAAEAVLKWTQRDGMALNAPIYTALMGAYANARCHPDEVYAVLKRMRAAGVTEDAPSWTCVVQAYLKHRMPNEAWDVFDEMRLEGIDPDAVTFTAMMHACALSDKLEEAQGLWMDMHINRVQPLLSTHNAFINACAMRCKTLVSLTPNRCRWLTRLAIDIRPKIALERAVQQMAKLQDEGFKADRFTYLALLRAHAALGDVRGTQYTLSAMLDADIAPRAAHFHVLLSACVRGMRLKPNTDHELYLEVAMAVPPSMQAAALPVDAKAVELIICAFASACRINRALELLAELPRKYAVSPSTFAFDALLRMAQNVRRPALAHDLLERMLQVGIEPTEKQLFLPQKIERDRQPRLRYPRMPAVSYSKSCGGFIHPKPLPTTVERWTLPHGNRAKQKRILQRIQRSQRVLPCHIMT